MQLTGWPTAIAAATRRLPGSEINGIPASEQSTTLAPATSAARTSWRRAALVVGVQGEHVLPPAIASWLSIRPVWRVSSQQMRSAAASAAAARGARSPRLPIGVATTSSAPPDGAFVSASPRAGRRRRAPNGRRHHARRVAAPRCGDGGGRCGRAEGRWWPAPSARDPRPAAAIEGGAWLPNRVRRVARGDRQAPPTRPRGRRSLRPPRPGVARHLEGSQSTSPCRRRSSHAIGFIPPGVLIGPVGRPPRHGAPRIRR